MAPPSRLAIAKSDIESTLSSLPTRVFTKTELTKVLNDQRTSWRLAKRTTTDEFIHFLLAKTRLTSVVLHAAKYEREVVRYAWGTASPFAIALSIGPPSAYLTHASAIYLHGLTDLIPRQVFVNVEQSPKPAPREPPTQVGIDRAFRSPQRSSNLIYEMEDGPAICMLSGKFTKGLEVELAEDPTGTSVRTTSIERTLIDAVVRPGYSGGLDNVLAAYGAAKDRVSVNRLRATLMQLSYAYPYHQAIGFMLQRAGYSETRVGLFRELGLNFDFYLAHAMVSPRYVKEWRLYVPEHLA